MNAKEQMKALGYVKEENDARILFKKGITRTLIFFKGIKYYKLFCLDNDLSFDEDTANYVSPQLHIAIHQQMKELGWIDEN